MLLESVPHEGLLDDNFTIPLVAAAVLTVLM
jgi:dolichol kinase